MRRILVCALAIDAVVLLADPKIAYSLGKCCGSNNATECSDCQYFVGPVGGPDFVSMIAPKKNILKCRITTDNLACQDVKRTCQTLPVGDPVFEVKTFLLIPYEACKKRIGVSNKPQDVKAEFCIPKSVPFVGVDDDCKGT